MHAITIAPDQQRLVSTTIPLPACQPHEVRIKVAYSGVNRADCLQVTGHYPLPEASPAVPGLEVSGTIDAIGEAVEGWEIGQRVCALLLEGGYGDYVCTDARLCLPVPDNVPLDEAAALPEALATGWYGLVELGELQRGERVLIHGGSSGVGHLAIQLARYLGAEIFTAASSAEKCELCRSLGAIVIPYPDNTPMELAQAVKVQAGGTIDVVLDLLGGDYIAANLKMLGYKGRLISIACMQGSEVQFSMGGFLMKNLRWVAMTLRSQPADIKASVIRQIEDQLWPGISEGLIRPYIDRRFPLHKASDAHDYMQSRQHMGKLVLEAG